MTCKECVCYLSDEDENGNVTEFYWAGNKKAEGFCAIRELFYNVKADDEACEDFQRAKE